MLKLLRCAQHGAVRAQLVFQYLSGSDPSDVGYLRVIRMLRLLRLVRLNCKSMAPNDLVNCSLSPYFCP